MNNSVSNKDAESCLRECLKKEGFSLSGKKGNGELGVDIIATKNGEKYHIEVIGSKTQGPQRSKDFYEQFFRTISRLKDGASNIVMAMPKESFENGMSQRANHYGVAWKRIGKVFPELKIWFIDCGESSYTESTWTKWLG